MIACSVASHYEIFTCPKKKLNEATVNPKTTKTNQIHENNKWGPKLHSIYICILHAPVIAFFVALYLKSLLPKKKNLRFNPKTTKTN